MAFSRKRSMAVPFNATDIANIARSNPYIQRLLEDPKLRKNVTEAVNASKSAYGRVNNGKLQAQNLLEDKKLHQDLGHALGAARDATITLTYAKRRRRKGLTFGRVLLIAGIGGGIAIAACWESQELIESAFSLHEYARDDELEAGPFTIRFCEVPHYVRTFAVEISSEDGARLTYSADCSPNDELVNFARETDLLLIEATLPRAERSGQRGHLTPAEAGEHGRRAGAKRLVLTHFSDELDRGWLMAEAAAGFGAEVELACDGATYTV